MSDKDGLEKNLDKLSKEWARLKLEMRPHVDRLKRDKDSHAYTNLFVEAMRISPYLLGHFDAIVYPLLILGLIVAVVWR